MVETQIIKEGETKLEIPKLERYRTSPHEYVPSLAPVFFNPLMETTRDISVAALQILSEESGELRICDAHAGVGARGLRYANEVEGISKVTANDGSSKAVEFIRRNIELNELSKVSVRNENVNVLLQEHRPRFDVIDLDPFGSPAPFISSACSALSGRGTLLATATDTALLCGAHPKACQRKYGSRSLRTPYYHELGLRILIGHCQRVAAQRDLALRPILSYRSRHYFRIHMKARRGARKANSVLNQQGYVSHCFKCGDRVITPGLPAELPKECECGGEAEHSGPMWLGRMVDKEFVKRVAKELLRRNFRLNVDSQKLLKLCLSEVDGPPTFYDLHKMCSQLGTSPPKLNKVINALKGQGYFASGTHFSNTGVRTDAPMEELLDNIFKR